MTVAQLAGWHATAFRERFGEPVDVMGISGGGITALQLELDHPGTVRRLVLCIAARIGSRLIAHGPLRLLLFASRVTVNVSRRGAGLRVVRLGQIGKLGGNNRQRLLLQD